jgi:hypothetical protein
MAGMDTASQSSIAEREWSAQKWRCVGMFSALSLWLGAILAYPNVPAIVRWAQAPIFLILTPVFIRDTMRKWRSYRGEAS